MAKGYLRGLLRAKPNRNGINKQRFVIKNKSFVSSGLTGVGFGTVVLGGLPQGNLLFLGAVSYLQFSTASANVTATWDGDYAFGTAPSSSNIALATDKANIITSTAIGAATAKLSPYARGISPAPAAPIDNTDGSLELNLNFLIDDAAVSADANTFVVNGLIEVSYIVLLDD